MTAINLLCGNFVMENGKCDWNYSTAKGSKRIYGMVIDEIQFTHREWQIRNIISK